MTATLIGAIGAIAVMSFILSPRVQTADGFFRGTTEAGAPPGLPTLVLSQVTTWIFARSLLNAAILGYFYGIAGTIAYAAYYLSFLTGGAIIDSIRFRHGHESVQSFLHAQFGRLGTITYNAVVGVRLISEVFANLLVIGLIFGLSGTLGYIASIIAVAVLTLGYSMLGGFRASLRTDVLQMSILLVVLGILIGQALYSDYMGLGDMMASSPDLSSPGWVLLAVALLQVWSYPLHDPVMMDRGFLADRRTTRRSFLHAGWVSLICIVAFGLLGVMAGLHKLDGEDLVATLTRLLGEPTMTVFNIALILSAVSTLDSTFTSAAKLSVVDMRMGAATAHNGRIAMAIFLLAGLALLFLGSEDLFEAVAVSGTASMFLAPVVFFCVWGNRKVAPWSYGVAFAAAMTGAAWYFLESSGYLSLIEPLFGYTQKYTGLLIISVLTLAIGCIAFVLGLRREPASG